MPRKCLIYIPQILDCFKFTDNFIRLTLPISAHDHASSPQVHPKFKKMIELATNEYQSVRELTELCGFKDPEHFREDYISGVS